ncbi:MAG: type II secretion system GspH family protein [Planctomycetaceae bacterium]|nr:type II secretion system GspH family protein [Planctomycetaceae bacterium]
MIRRPVGLGMTLTELLVVIAVLGILVTLLIPATSNLLGRVNETVCASQLRSIGQAAVLARQDAGANGQIASANWQVTLYPKVDKAAKVFLCPDGPVPVNDSSGEVTPPTPGGEDIEGNYVIVQSFYPWSDRWESGYDTYAPGGYPLSDDSPWILHFSQHQKDTITTTDSYGNPNPPCYFGYNNAFWAQWDPVLNRWAPPSTYVYESDGSGTSYWGITFGIHWGSAYTNVFMKAEPAGSGGGVRLWTNHEAISGTYSSTFSVLTTEASESVVTSKGVGRLAPSTGFAMQQRHDLPGSYHVPQPGQTLGYLTTGPGPILQTERCHSSSICPNAPGQCDGRNDWIIIGEGKATIPGAPGAPGTAGGFNCTNYGMNSLAGGMSRPEQIFALDYADTIAKPEEDNWSAATWDADSDGRLDFARHRVRGGQGRVNVLFVDGVVRSMTAAEIDPLFQELRDRYWKP